MAGTKKPTAILAPSKHGYEFGGPIGAVGIVFGLPIVCYLFAFICNDVSGCPAPSTLHPSTFTLERLKREVNWQGTSTLLTLNAFLATIGYYTLSLVLNVGLPATETEGIELQSGGKLKYRFNAFNSALFTVSLLGAGTLAQGADFVVWTYIWNNYIPLMTSNLIISYALATFVYVRSFSVKSGNAERRELANGGQSGNMLYDWFIGRELNPRVMIPLIGEIDIKAWCELRPGMLGWVILDLAAVAKQYRNYGYVTDSILMVTFAQALYIFDALYMEPAILTTIDITTDGFGFMLSFGDLVWLPFTYCTQTRYLATDPVKLGFLGIAGVLAVQGTGYYIFRATNNEKNRFRNNPKDPKVAHLEYIQTKTGSKLLVSGWWGTARHINYLADWLMSWSFCLPTGFAGYIIERDYTSLGNSTEVVPGEARGWGMIFTYFFMLYFAVLLIHRERRDEEKCKRKYGKDWDEYCKRVPYRIVPGVY